MTVVLAGFSAPGGSGAVGKFHLQSLQTRALSASILIPVVLFAVVWGGWPFYLMVGALACISVHEWLMMTRQTDRRFMHASWGLIYIFFGFLFCILIRENQSFYAATLFLLMVWSADIGAFFSGKSIGGPKMAPTISPNKTWAGFAGALSFAGMVGVLFYLGYQALSYESFWTIGSLVHVFIVGVLVGFVGQKGDLLVSMMKRIAAVKDTGTLIPGHGGLLDRIDSMLLAAPVFYFLYDLFALRL